MQEKITSKDISVVVQGPIIKHKTEKCLKSIRKNLPEAEIILSTWEGSSIDGLDYDILVINIDPGAVRQKKFTTAKVFSNLNRMILSTNNGIQKAERKYTLKLRTDACIDNTGFLNMFEKFPARFDEYKLFEHRILTSTLYSKFAITDHENKVEIPFHVSDWWFFGLTSDLKKFLLSSKPVEEPYFSNYFEYPENAGKVSVFKKFDWRFAPEQYLAYSCFSKYFEDIKMDDCSEITDEIIEKSKRCLINNFVFLEYKQSGIRSLKYLFSKFEPLAGDIYMDLYTFFCFESEYKKYCDSSYISFSENIIFSNRESAYGILRLYKHICKLFDPEASLKTKLEQVLIGIPVSAVALIKIFLKSSGK